MDSDKKFIITISRQLGSGGAYVGKQLAQKLDIYYADREILSEAARKFSLGEEDLIHHEEKLRSLWKSFLQFNALSTEVDLPPRFLGPTSRELYQTEAEIIEQIAQERSAVIIGRCGFHILRNYPNCIKIFLHADAAFRNSRIQELYEVSEDAAAKMIVKNDKERGNYISTFTGKQWTDARQYDLSIDTGKIGVDHTVDLILNYLEINNLN